MTELMTDKERETIAKWAKNKSVPSLVDWWSSAVAEREEFSVKRTNATLIAAIVDAELRNRQGGVG